jgi:hypothetical protein
MGESHGLRVLSTAFKVNECEERTASANWEFAFFAQLVDKTSLIQG